tara:strand:- start:6361 stop:7593 length:1233 start_codon:yes stop_codon:yes gene_type:complete
MTSEQPIRIASEFAPYPFRLLAQNAPMVWTDGDEFKIRLKQQDINISLAEQLLNHQAPVVYADDLLAIAEVEGDVRVDLHAINDIPTAMPAFDRMFVEVNMQPFVKRSKRASDDLLALAGYVVCDPFPKEQADIIRDLVFAHATTARARNSIESKVDEVRDQLSGENQAKVDGILERLKTGIRIPKAIFRTGFISEESIEIIKTAKFVSIYPYILVKAKGKDRRSNVRGQCIGPVGQIIYMVDPNAGLVRLENGEPWQLWMDPVKTDEETYLYEESAAFYDDCAQTAAALSMRVMALLNCSNVQLVDQGKTTDGINKKDVRQHRLRSLQYHELRVKVGKELLPVYGRGGLTGTKGLGIVRGHFRDYSKGKGLFGRLKYPAVWVPPHARGDAMNGVIMKDYALVPGGDQNG